jgi:hypothetical protein
LTINYRPEQALALYHEIIRHNSGELFVHEGEPDLWNDPDPLSVMPELDPDMSNRADQVSDYEWHLLKKAAGVTTERTRAWNDEDRPIGEVFKNLDEVKARLTELGYVVDQTGYGLFTPVGSPEIIIGVQFGDEWVLEIFPSGGPVVMSIVESKCSSH